MVLLLIKWHIIKQKGLGIFLFNDFFRQKMRNPLDDAKKTLYYNNSV